MILNLEFRSITRYDHNLMYSSDSVNPSEPLLESQYLWVSFGIALGVARWAGIENKRRSKAKEILNQFAIENKWN